MEKRDQKFAYGPYRDQPHVRVATHDTKHTGPKTCPPMPKLVISYAASEEIMANAGRAWEALSREAIGADTPTAHPQPLSIIVARALRDRSRAHAVIDRAASSSSQ